MKWNGIRVEGSAVITYEAENIISNLTVFINTLELGKEPVIYSYTLLKDHTKWQDDRVTPGFFVSILDRINLDKVYDRVLESQLRLVD